MGDIHRPSTPPDELDDRAQDIWEPLLAIADAAGGEWPKRARGAVIALSGGERRGDGSLQVRVLADVRHVFDLHPAGRIKTSEMLTALAAVEESPWGDWFGKQLSSSALSKLLKPFGIRTMAVKVDGETVRGYKREQFEDAWSRYLPKESVTGVPGVTAGAALEAESNGGNASNAAYAGLTVEERTAAECHPKLFPPNTPAEQIREQLPAVLAIEAEIAAPPDHTQGG